MTGRHMSKMWMHLYRVHPKCLCCAPCFARADFRALIRYAYQMRSKIFNKRLDWNFCLKMCFHLARNLSALSCRWPSLIFRYFGRKSKIWLRVRCEMCLIERGWQLTHIHVSADMWTNTGRSWTHLYSVLDLSFCFHWITFIILSLQELLTGISIWNPTL